KHIIILKERNFTTIVENNRLMMVEFNSPWCSHCKSLAPEYVVAATELEYDDVDLRT
ncbi:hypothetical protein TanjilG_23162, partial [Lupinus angustifolius]